MRIAIHARGCLAGGAQVDACRVGLRTEAADGLAHEVDEMYRRKRWTGRFWRDA